MRSLVWDGMGWDETLFEWDGMGWEFFEILGVSQRYLRGMLPRLWQMILHIAASLRNTPYPQWPKNRFAGQVKNGQKYALVAIFDFWRKWCMTYVPDFFYRVKLLDRHLFAKKQIFDPPSFKIFWLQKILKFWVITNLRVVKYGGWVCRSDPRFFSETTQVEYFKSLE